LPQSGISIAETADAFTYIARYYPLGSGQACLVKNDEYGLLIAFDKVLIIINRYSGRKTGNSKKVWLHGTLSSRRRGELATIAHHNEYQAAISQMAIPDSSTSGVCEPRSVTRLRRSVANFFANAIPRW
jgi:hypothetical protein